MTKDVLDAHQLHFDMCSAEWKRALELRKKFKQNRVAG